MEMNINILKYIADSTATIDTHSDLGKTQGFIHNNVVYNAITTNSAFELLIMHAAPMVIKIMVVSNKVKLSHDDIFNLFNVPNISDIEHSNIKVLDINLDTKEYLDTLVSTDTITWGNLETLAEVTKSKHSLVETKEVILNIHNDPIDKSAPYIHHQSLVSNLRRSVDIKNGGFISESVKIAFDVTSDNLTVVVNNNYLEGFVSIYVVGSGLVSYTTLIGNNIAINMNNTVKEWVEYFITHHEDCYDVDISNRANILKYLAEFDYTERVA